VRFVFFVAEISRIDPIALRHSRVTLAALSETGKKPRLQLCNDSVTRIAFHCPLICPVRCITNVTQHPLTRLPCANLLGPESERREHYVFPNAKAPNSGWTTKTRRPGEFSHVSMHKREFLDPPLSPLANWLFAHIPWYLGG